MGIIYLLHDSLLIPVSFSTPTMIDILYLLLTLQDIQTFHRTFLQELELNSFVEKIG